MTRAGPPGRRPYGARRARVGASVGSASVSRKAARISLATSAEVRRKPIAEQTAAVCAGTISPADALATLMHRRPRRELHGLGSGPGKMEP